MIEQAHGEYCIGKREDDVVIRNGEEIVKPVFDPLTPSRALAFGAMTVAAGVIGHFGMSAAITAIHVVPESATTTILDRAHNSRLLLGQCMGLTKGIPVEAKDIGYFIFRPVI